MATESERKHRYAYTDPKGNTHIVEITRHHGGHQFNTGSVDVKDVATGEEFKGVRNTDLCILAGTPGQ